ncbi:MAG: hypothetical protein AAFY16_08330 [Cyanobacteria bacterium J06642_3]
MGNFHCIPSSCARVVWREYLPPVIRWRYPDEDWQEIEANNYEIKEYTERFNYTPRKAYRIHCKMRVAHRVPPNEPPYDKHPTKYYADQELELRTINAFNAPITNYQPNFDLGSLRLDVTYTGSKGGNSKGDFCTPVTGIFAIYHIGSDGRNSAPQISGKHINAATVNWNVGLYDWRLVEATEYSPKPCLEIVEVGCHFSIYKNDIRVYHRVDKNCPEVEQLPCRLSEFSKEIEIKKEAYFQRIEVRDQSIDVVYLSPLEAPFIDVNPLPNECLNIYNTYTLAPPILSNFVPLPGVINPYIFIKQICSADGCPPPEYEVICDCDCQDCPDGTCATRCADHICCYDTSTGQAVLEIPLDKYCGGKN